MTANKDFIYNLWAVVAVQGLMSQADQILRQYRDEILSVARKYQRTLPAKTTTLYRGLLLETDGHAETDTLKTPYEVEFLSFTENLEVACQFASTDSFMGSFVMAQRPSSKGYVITHSAKREDVLFHYKWHFQAGISKDLRKIEANLLMNGIHTDLNQYLHNVKVQKEVILKPTTEEFNLIPKHQLSDMSGLELDLKYLPSWVIDELGIRKKDDPTESNPKYHGEYAYRVQNSKGQGPYRGKHTRKHPEIFGSHDQKARNKKRPNRSSVFYDQGFTEKEKRHLEFVDGYITGFASIKQLYQWFDNETELEKLRKYGYAIYKVKIKKSYPAFKGKMQIIFVPSGRSIKYSEL